MSSVYLDHSATTPVAGEVLEAMLPYFSERFGNASTIHGLGQQARAGIEQAREILARSLQAREAEIVFLSGGTEADNLGIQGSAFAMRDRGNHIITSEIEHHAVRETCDQLQQHGFAVTFLKPDAAGMIHPEMVREAMTPKTILVSIMHANNEIGTINPIAEIGAVVHSGDAVFHTDAVQSYGKIPISVDETNIDLMSLSGHKIYGPKGIGALYVRQGTPMHKTIFGGSQELGRRGGTENVPAIVGLGKAAQICMERMQVEDVHLRDLRTSLWQLIQDRIDEVYLNGHPEERIAGHLNISVAGVDAESLMISLDLKGIAVSTGSACSSGSSKPSHVLTGIGLPQERLRGTLRMTLGRTNSEEDIIYTADTLAEAVVRLRSLTPAG